MPMPTDMSFAVRLREHQQEYQEYLPLTERVQADLRIDVDTLRAQEGWDQGAVLGVEEWVNDIGGIWRALRRHRYDPDKTLAGLLSTLTYRLSLSLHLPISSSSPYAHTSLFHILPLPRFSTRAGQPIVVITLQEVRRDAAGRLDDMKEWTWWALEMVRRVVKDWWMKGKFPEAGTGEIRGTGKDKRTRRGYGGEGCVLLVDAARAGYRNLEVELLPTLFSVGHNHFPGMFDSVHVVNAGWAQRSMWTMVKRMLPKSADEKVSFLDDCAALEEVFVVERLPSCYGGRAEWVFSPECNIIFNHYSKHSAPASLTATPVKSPSLAPAAASLPSRSASSSSLADIFYTAENTPTSSRHASRRGSLSTPGLTGGALGHDLRMTRMDLRRIRSTGTSVTTSEDRADAPAATEERAHPRSTLSDDGADQPRPDPPRRTYHRRPSAVTSPVLTPLQRIKSLSDFHLYLSPSRLANLDLLSDSSDSDTETRVILPPAARRFSLRPIIADPEATIREQDLASRRSGPPLRLLGAGVAGEVGGGESVRTYSDRLSLHHAHALKAYTKSPEIGEGDATGTSAEEPEALTPIGDQSAPMLQGLPVDSMPVGTQSPETVSAPSQPGLASHVQSPAVDQPATQAVSAYSRSTNPWFGYPAVRLSSPHPKDANHLNGRIIPLYPRNRKRDLVKTLLFLFMLRLQTLRDSLERKLGLHHLGSMPWSTSWREAKGPSEGLKMMSQGSKGGRWGVNQHRARWKERGEWVWMIIGFVLFRGTWAKVLASISAPLGALGLGGARDVLGLA